MDQPDSSRAAHYGASRRRMLTGAAFGATGLAGAVLASSNPARAATLSAPDWTVSPSGDMTGATDRANIQAALADNGFVQLVAGTYYINAPLELTASNQVLCGAGHFATVIQLASGFAGSIQGITAGIFITSWNCQVRHLSLAGLGSTYATAITGIEVMSGFATIEDVDVALFSGWGVELINLNSSGVHQINSGWEFRNVTGQSGCAGGIHISGNAYPDTGGLMLNCGINAGVTSGPNPNLDCILIENSADDVGIIRCGANIEAGSGSIVHVRGTVTALLMTECDIGINNRSPGNPVMLIENDASGNMPFEMLVSNCTFTGGKTSLQINGGAYNLKFTGCQFFNNLNAGVIMSGTGSADFVNCDFGSDAGAANGQSASGTIYDLNWSGTGSGSIQGCSFGSPIATSGHSGVQVSIFLNSSAPVQVLQPHFRGNGTAHGNQCTILPMVAGAFTDMPLAQGAVTLTAGSATVTCGLVNTSFAPYPTQISLRVMNPTGTPGALYVSSVTSGTGFKIKSTSTSDTSEVWWGVYSSG
jgi:hypothetical protein